MAGPYGARNAGMLRRQAMSSRRVVTYTITECCPGCIHFQLNIDAPHQCRFDPKDPKDIGTGTFNPFPEWCPLAFFEMDPKWSKV